MASKAVAVVGMCGSGKSVVTEIFLQNGWQSVYFGGVTVNQLKKQNLSVNEQNEREMREGLRKKYGMGAYAMLLYDEIRQKLQLSNTVLDGLYSWSEYKFLKEKLGDDLIVLAIVANSGVRYSRLSCREVRPLTTKEAKSRDISEVENLEKGGPIAVADYFISNNGTVEELRQQCKNFLSRLNENR